MVNANATQRQASAAIDSGDDFSHKLIQAIDNYDNFDQSIMALGASQSEDYLNRAAQCEMEPEGDFSSKFSSVKP